jgi:hypothetical protein
MLYLYELKVHLNFLITTYAKRIYIGFIGKDS